MKTTMRKLTALAISAVLALGVIIPASAAVVEYGAELANAPDKSNYSQTFSDVSKSYWAFGYIGEMTNRGVLSGYPDGKFYPDKNVTRAEFAKIMTSAASLSVNNYVTWSEYVDVNDHWAAPYVNAAAYYLGGYTMNGSKYYQPDNPALREDIAVALVRLKGYSTAGYDLSIIQTMFSDWQSISTSAQPYVAIAVEKGLISGYDDGTFKGQQGITRAEAATLLWRAYQYGNDNKVYEPEILPEIVVTPEPTVAPTPTPTVKPTKTPKPAEEPEDDDEYDYEDAWNDDECTWTVTTIKHGVDDIYQMQIVPDGLSYMMSSDDNQIYCMNTNGKTGVIFDADDLDYLSDVELTRKDTVTTTLHCYGYNYYDDCYYAIISQTNTGIFLYNITDDELVVTLDFNGYTNQWREGILSPIKFYKNGDILLKAYIIDSEGGQGECDIIVTTDKKIIIEDKSYSSRSRIFGRNNCIIIGNKKYDYPDEFLSESYVERNLAKPYIYSQNKLYGWDYDDVWNVSSKRIQLMSIDFESGDADILLFMDKIENPEGRKFDIEQILMYGVIDDEDEGNEVIYFYDRDYETIRKIERNN